MREHLFSEAVLSLVREECSIEEVYGDEVNDKISEYLATFAGAVWFVPLKELEEAENTLALVEAENDDKDGRIDALEEEVVKLKKELHARKFNAKKVHHI